ncbi:ADP-heptose synthase [Dissulfuribacter thermophilus]|uniref:ADP-heptose synthase n=1 Tax=Dissulfuribacter thermophilus TaxID=1156395 RepID=A0A1B9F5E6_9BACT|nr:D-glycero-beta-D-manno-heptose-7-phosphate kinase [Dissulfuribacter thermophilus]OCC15035.1 ADP-heptose synthase [Dissulfuribacter thermophilus]
MIIQGTNLKPTDISKDRLFHAIYGFSDAKIFVIGDCMLDHYIWGDSDRISPEAPVPVVSVEKEEFHLGGAANVAQNISALSGKVDLSGIVGKDGPAAEFKELLRNLEISWHGIVDSERPTTQKMRVIARGQQLIRVDREDTTRVSAEHIDMLCTLIHENLRDSSCIVISDYAKGVVCKGLMDFLVSESKKYHIPIIVDPKPQNVMIYNGVDVITPNKKEALSMAQIFEEKISLDVLMKKLRDEVQVGAVLVTLGEKGMAVFESGDVPYHIPTMAREVFDVTGAGDTVIATLALGMSMGLNLLEASFLANIAGGIVVGKVGTATLSQEELLQGVEKAFE